MTNSIYVYNLLSNLLLFNIFICQKWFFHYMYTLFICKYKEFVILVSCWATNTNICDAKLFVHFPSEGGVLAGICEWELGTKAGGGRDTKRCHGPLQERGGGLGAGAFTNPKEDIKLIEAHTHT